MSVIFFFRPVFNQMSYTRIKGHSAHVIVGENLFSFIRPISMIIGYHLFRNDNICRIFAEIMLILQSLRAIKSVLRNGIVKKLKPC